MRRLTAFAVEPGGGNPAGVWVGDALPDAAVMQAVAADVGYSETAFLAPRPDGTWLTRYFAPTAEVPFCGHATIAAGVVLGDTLGDGTYTLATPVGEVEVVVVANGGVRTASLTSVATTHEPAAPTLLAVVLAVLGWGPEELDRSLPPARAFAGAWHLVLACATRDRLAALDYDFEDLRRIMERAGLTTIQLVWQEDPTTFHARNPFPVGGVVEDPATGAAAAALGGYLRDSGALTAPFELTIRQGFDMGRPSTLEVSVPEEGGVVVTGPAVEIAP